MHKVHFLLISIFYYANADFEWMYLVPYGSNVTLKPLKRAEFDSEDFELKKCEWRTPNGIRIRPHHPNDWDNVHYFLNEDSCELTIFNIQKHTNGIYHCMINDQYVSKAMLNYHGPPSKNFFDEYKWNFLAGFSSAGCK